MIALNLYQKTEYEVEKALENINLQALFMFINHQAQ